MTALRACLVASAATLALVSTAAIVVSVTTPTARYDDATLRAHIAASDKLASVHHEVLRHDYCNENDRKRYECYKLVDVVDALTHAMLDGRNDGADVASYTFPLTETTNIVIKSNKSNGGRVLTDNRDVPSVELTSILKYSNTNAQPLLVTFEEASSIATCSGFAGTSWMMSHNTKCRCPGPSSLDDSGIAKCEIPKEYWLGLGLNVDWFPFALGGQLNCGTTPQGTFTLDGDVFTCNPPACDTIMFWNGKCFGDPGMDVRCDPVYVWGWPIYSDFGMAIFDSGMYSCL